MDFFDNLSLMPQQTTILRAENRLHKHLACRPHLQTDVCVFHTLLSQTGDGEVLAVLLKVELASCSGLGSKHLHKINFKKKWKQKKKKKVVILKLYMWHSEKNIHLQPATFLHVGFDLVHIDLCVQQSGEVCRAGLSSSGHLQVVQIQPEVGVTHCATGVPASKTEYFQTC